MTATNHGDLEGRPERGVAADRADRKPSPRAFFLLTFAQSWSCWAVTGLSSLLAVAMLLGVLTGGLPLPVANAAPVATGLVDTAVVDRFVEAQMDKHGIPGLALAVVEDGRVTYVRGYGHAGAGRPMAADVPMPIGSVTKTFTAVAVLQLVERGRIDLDAPVRTYLPWFRVAGDDASAAITVRHLLQHTSGLSDLGYNRVLDPRTPLEDGVADLRHARLTARVGASFQYFNPNYSTLALIVETVSGRSYGDYVEAHIFGPLGMAHSSGNHRDAAVAGMAQGHSKLFGFAVPRDAPTYRYMFGAGDLVSTAPDLARFAVALGNQGAYGDTRILSPGSVELMRTVSSTDESAYGMGWVVAEHRGEPVGFHDGADTTSMSQLAVLPDRDRGYALVMNQNHLIDGIVVLPQLQAGMLDLMTGRPAPGSGVSVRLIGAVVLVIFLVVTAFAVRSVLSLRGWTQRARTLTTRQLTRAIVPRFIAPIVTIVAVYQLGPLLLGRTFNVAWVGRWYAPDLLLLLAVATIPDLLQGLYMLGAAVAQRSSSRRAGVGASDSMRPVAAAVPPDRAAVVPATTAGRNQQREGRHERDQGDAVGGGQQLLGVRVGRRGHCVPARRAGVGCTGREVAVFFVRYRTELLRPPHPARGAWLAGATVDDGGAGHVRGLEEVGNDGEEQKQGDVGQVVGADIAEGPHQRLFEDQRPG